MIDKSKLNDIERDLVEGMEGFLADVKDDKSVMDMPEKYTCRRVVLKLTPQVYTAAEVKATRKMLRVSQALFAQFLGVSRKSVAAWEGGRTPPAMACRLMDEIQRRPELWRERLNELIETRTTCQD
jgi:putative transcriptional regulator